jgi:hypothetical protein
MKTETIEYIDGYGFMSASFKLPGETVEDAIYRTMTERQRDEYDVMKEIDAFLAEG